MSSAAVRAEVDRILAAEWTASRVVDLHNAVNAHGTDLTPWVWPMYPLAVEEQIGLGKAGDRYWRETGDVHFVFGVVPNSGDAGVQALATGMQRLFRGRAVLDGNLVFRDVSPLRDFIADRAVTGNWYVAAVAASYLYTFTDAEA